MKSNKKTHINKLKLILLVIFSTNINTVYANELEISLVNASSVNNYTHLRYMVSSDRLEHNIIFYGTCHQNQYSRNVFGINFLNKDTIDTPDRNVIQDIVVLKNWRLVLKDQLQNFSSGYHTFKKDDFNRIIKNIQIAKFDRNGDWDDFIEVVDLSSKELDGLVNLCLETQAQAEITKQRKKESQIKAAKQKKIAKAKKEKELKAQKERARKNAKEERMRVATINHQSQQKHYNSLVKNIKTNTGLDPMFNDYTSRTFNELIQLFIN